MLIMWEKLILFLVFLLIGILYIWIFSDPTLYYYLFKNR
ncbi:MAG: hypothetical protein KatS3mg097_290 [Candidatus Parcubacteria bacterium]|nr:MAG: hypothetical protein KatS3mg097_290 [Candidatus Parcubacteria bacterium]